MSGVVKNFRETYHLKPMPVKEGEEVITKTREYITFLETSGVLTHPQVRQIHSEITLQLATLIGVVEAQRTIDNGGGPDEMDGWEKAGIKIQEPVLDSPH